VVDLTLDLVFESESLEGLSWKFPDSKSSIRTSPQDFELADLVLGLVLESVGLDADGLLFWTVAASIFPTSEARLSLSFALVDLALFLEFLTADVL
jgi:hypothetical protein